MSRICQSFPFTLVILNQRIPIGILSATPELLSEAARSFAAYAINWG